MLSAQHTLGLDAREPIAHPSNQAETTATGWRVEVFDAPQPLKADWLALERDATVPFTSYAWAEAWYETVARARGHLPVIVVGRTADGRAAYILPFVLERRGPFAVLLWPGGTHCAYQCGLFSRACREDVARHGAQAFWNEVFAHLPEVDAIAAYGLPGFEEERDNPLHALPAVDASCVSYRLDTTAGWPRVYQTKSTSRQRSEDRRCERRLNELGDVRFTVAETPEERERLVTTLLDQKSVQLHAHGAPDFTSGDGVRQFYGRLATSPYWADGSQPYMSVIEVDGRPAAINLGLIKDDTFHGLVLSMAEGGAARFGPGRQLLNRTLEQLCGRGLRTVDMGAGEESHKLKWADTSVPRRDVLVALTPRGRVFVAIMRAMFAAKTAIKRSPTLWRLFSRYRRYLGC